MDELADNLLNKIQLSASDLSSVNFAFNNIPDVYHLVLMSRFVHGYKRDEKKARDYLTSLFDQVSGKNLVDTLEQIQLRADDSALYCRAKTYQQSVDFCLMMGVKPPLVQGYVTEQGSLQRMGENDWWMRRLRKKHYQNREAFAINQGLVSERRSKYCTQLRADEVQVRDIMTHKRMSETFIYADNGTSEMSLYDAYKASVNNPVNRFAEMMVKLKGMENYSLQQGGSSKLLTLTAPSKNHAYLKSGRANKKFKGFTPTQTKNYLMNLWAKGRVKLLRAGIRPYGLRVVEPHHDGTPHFHILLFGDREALIQTDCILEKLYCEEDYKELKGDLSKRYHSVWIDPKKGSAVGYVTKYISKNMKDSAVAGKSTIEGSSQNASKVSAWASTWNIRTFAFFGTPSATVWREIRRVDDIDTGRDPVFDQLREVSQDNDWCQFATILEKNQIKTMYEHCGNNQYGEPTKKIVGLYNPATKKELVTRRMQWFRQPQSIRKMNYGEDGFFFSIDEQSLFEEEIEIAFDIGQAQTQEFEFEQVNYLDSGNEEHSPSLNFETSCLQQDEIYTFETESILYNGQ